LPALDFASQSPYSGCKNVAYSRNVRRNFFEILCKNIEKRLTKYKKSEMINISQGKGKQEMKNFDSMEQRIISMYMDLFPGFKPDSSDGINESSQLQFYNFIKSIINSLYMNPLLLFPKINKDDYFTRRFNKHSENKQSVYNMMRKNIKILQDFFQFLFDAGVKGCIKDELFLIKSVYKIPKKYIEIIEHCGLIYSRNEGNHILKHKETNEIFTCWKWFSAKPGITLPHFIGCMFDFNYSYTGEIYKKLSGDEEAYSQLEYFFSERNYIRIDNRDNKITVDYVKNYDKKEENLKAAWAERAHGGFSAEYDGMMKNPQLYSLRIPFYKRLLQEFDKVENGVKEFIVNTGKKCDNCRYCVQTDKSGKRELAFISVCHDKGYKICSYFPGFHYCWEKLDNRTVRNIIGFLTFADKVLTKK
jgi:hypothetical protein